MDYIGLWGYHGASNIWRPSSIIQPYMWHLKHPGGIFTVRIIITNSWFRHSETSILMQKKWVSELEGLTFAATRPQCFLFSKKLQVESRQLRDVRRSCFQNSPSHPSSSVSTSIQTKYLMQVI